nr:hypothetical protein [uncultured archaeon]CAI64235.1 hypothetical protein [uncultured archaeon]
MKKQLIELVAQFQVLTVSTDADALSREYLEYLKIYIVTPDDFFEREVKGVIPIKEKEEMWRRVSKEIGIKIFL